MTFEPFDCQECGQLIEDPALPHSYQDCLKHKRLAAGAIDWTIPGPGLPAMMRMTILTEPWPEGGKPIECPVCGESWRPWRNSYLPCHGRCLWTDEGAIEIYRSPLSCKELCEMLGVTYPTLNVGIRRGVELSP